MKLQILLLGSLLTVTGCGIANPYKNEPTRTVLVNGTEVKTNFVNNTQVSDDVILQTWLNEQQFMANYHVAKSTGCAYSDCSADQYICPCPEVMNLQPINFSVNQVGDAHQAGNVFCGDRDPSQISACTDTPQDTIRVAGFWLIGIPQSQVEIPEYQLGWELGTVMLSRIGKDISHR